MATAIVLAARQLLPSLNSPSCKYSQPKLNSAKARHEELKKKLEELRTHRAAAQSEAENAEDEVRRLRRQLGTIEYGRKMQQIAVFEDNAHRNEQVKVMDHYKADLAEVQTKAYGMRDEVDSWRCSVRQRVSDAVKEFMDAEHRRQVDTENTRQATWEAHCVVVNSQQERISQLQKQLDALNDCIVHVRGRDALAHLGQNAIQKRHEKMQAKYQSEVNKESTFMQKQLLQNQQRNQQLLWQEQQHLNNLRDKKLLEKNQESVALLAERAELRNQIKEAREKTLLEEQRGCETHEELEKSAIVARAAQLAENDMVKKPTYSFIKQARETLNEITGEFTQKAAQEAELKKEITNDVTFSEAKQKFNRHCNLLESCKILDALSAKPSLAATPAVQGVLDGHIHGAVLLGEMSQLHDQMQEVKSCAPSKTSQNDVEQDMLAVLAEIEGIVPSEFLKDLPDMSKSRSVTPSTDNGTDNFSRSDTSSSW